jgi:hypothetical protein
MEKLWERERERGLGLTWVDETTRESLFSQALFQFFFFLFQ